MDPENYGIYSIERTVSCVYVEILTTRNILQEDWRIDLL